MSAGSGPDQELTEAEQALSTHLELLRLAPPQARHSMVARVVRAARWQRAIRRPVLAVAALAAAMLTGVRLLFGGRDKS